MNQIVIEIHGVKVNVKNVLMTVKALKDTFESDIHLDSKSNNSSTISFDKDVLMNIIVKDMTLFYQFGIEFYFNIAHSNV